MIRDRGRIKWVSMMLPEHVKLLREYNESLDKVEKPVLDEQKYEEFNEVICRAMEENITLQFTYYQKGEMKKLVGNIHYIDQLKRELRIVDYLTKKHVLKLGDIIEIEQY
ncbi:MULTISPECIES: YolD-like family protein [Bacillaceae]|uniref:YolD-like family protein n=1 Tax=Mesobacillus zeae TaxID=1917180 RepID=A0A398B293_9BACI|nr:MULTISPECIES: YolD-like family protein [Bacillaceae]RID83965.1 YolD-like family protein [Mesobacillus zeae]